MEDAKELWDQFDQDFLARPQGPEQFLVGLFALLVVGAVIFVAIRLIGGWLS